MQVPNTNQKTSKSNNYRVLHKSAGFFQYCIEFLIIFQQIKNSFARLHKLSVPKLQAKFKIPIATDFCNTMHKRKGNNKRRI